MRSWVCNSVELWIESSPACPICENDITRDDEIVALPCNHLFHPNCIVPWIEDVMGLSMLLCSITPVPHAELNFHSAMGRRRRKKRRRIEMSFWVFVRVHGSLVTALLEWNITNTLLTNVVIVQCLLELAPHPNQTQSSYRDTNFPSHLYVRFRYESKATFEILWLTYPVLASVLSLPMKK